MIDFQADDPHILKEYLKYSLAIGSFKLSTCTEYEYDLITFIKFYKCQKDKKCINIDYLKTVKIEDIPDDYFYDIEFDDIENYFLYLIDVRKNTITTKNRKASSLKNFLGYLEERDLVNKSLSKKDFWSAKYKHELPYFLSLEISKKLLYTVYNNNEDLYKKRNYCIITFFLNLGLRLSELCNINLSDIKLEDKLIYITGKGNKHRIIHLNYSCMKALEDYLNIRNSITPKDIYSKDALFLSRKKRRISRRMIQELVRKYFKEVEIDTDKYSVHKLRHTAATLLLQNGVDIRTIQVILGQEEISTTEIYTHVADTNVKNTLSKNPISEILCS